MKKTELIPEDEFKQIYLKLCKEGEKYLRSLEFTEFTDYYIYTAVASVASVGEKLSTHDFFALVGWYLRSVPKREDDQTPIVSIDTFKTFVDNFHKNTSKPSL